MDKWLLYGQISERMDGWTEYYLDPGLSQFGPLGQLLPGVDVGVVGSLESLFKLL